MIRPAIASIALIGAALLQGCSTTVLSAPCDDPKVSNSSIPFVYLVMLPYVYRGDAAPSETYSSTIDSINDAARLQVVRMGVETTDMHVTLLRDEGQKCDIEGVYKAFTAKRFFERNLQSTVVFYWGDLFEVRDKILIQSHIRTLWKNPAENLIFVGVRSSFEGQDLKFTGSVPYATVSFPPRTLTVAEQPGAEAGLRFALESRSAPKSTATATPLPRKFIIHRRDGDWVELRDAFSATSVWVAVNDSASNVKSILPELSFAHALSAYASYSRFPDEHIADNAIRWIAEFRSAYDLSRPDDDLRQPLAVADVVEAVLLRAQGHGDTERRRADALMDKAVVSLPTNSAVLNLAAILKIEQCCGTRDAAIEIQRRLETARQLDAGNEMIAHNLLNWYRLLEDKEDSVWPESKAETRRRAAQLAEALR